MRKNTHMTKKENSVLVLPAEKYHLAQALLEHVRTISRLEFETEKAIDALAAESKRIPLSDLPEGEYGVLEYHAGANAWRNGELLVNHGETYICLYRYVGNGSFTIRNAWGESIERRVPGRVLLEQTSKGSETLDGR